MANTTDRVLAAFTASGRVNVPLFLVRDDDGNDAYNGSDPAAAEVALEGLLSAGQGATLVTSQRVRFDPAP